MSVCCGQRGFHALRQRPAGAAHGAIAELCVGPGLEFEHDSQGGVNVSQFVEAEVGDAFTKTGGVYRSSLLNQHARRLARKGHLGAETRRSR